MPCDAISNRARCQSRSATISCQIQFSPPHETSAQRFGSLCRALARMGYVRMGQTGSPLKLKNGSRTLSVPAHGSIAPGTLANILRQASVDIEELHRHLR